MNKEKNHIRFHPLEVHLFNHSTTLLNLDYLKAEVIFVNKRIFLIKLETEPSKQSKSHYLFLIIDDFILWPFYIFGPFEGICKYN